MSIMTTSQLHLAELVRLHNLRQAAERQQRRERLMETIKACIFAGLVVLFVSAVFFGGVLMAWAN